MTSKSHNKRYIISVDLDDTLLNSKKEITNESKKYIRRIVQNNHLFLINSGRPYQGLYQYVKELSLYNTPISVSNGAAIVYIKENEEIIQHAYTFPIPKIIFHELFLEVSPFIEACLASSLYTIYTYHEEKIPFWMIHKNHLVEHFEGLLNEVVFEDILNASFQVYEKDYDHFFKIINQGKYRDLFFYNWGTYDGITTIEVSLKIANKGHAIQFISQLYGIDSKNTIAFGDAENDIAMLKAASEGVAMVNARETVKKSIHIYTTLSNNENGVIDYLLSHHKELFK